MSVKCKHIDLKLTTPSFDSKLTELIMELNHLRKRELGGTTHPHIFFQLKKIFHTLESIGSARIEGNRTTIIEFIETKIDNKKSTNEKHIEINNNEKALELIDNNIAAESINRAFLSELHKTVVENLTPPTGGEGSRWPGKYRKIDVRIARSQHIPPLPVQVQSYMDELFRFINDISSLPQYDLLKVAIAHHRLAWIHPFDNGNGRLVRLFTYAMLAKLGFNVHIGRIINPVAVFCSDRDKYYDLLGKADSGDASDMLVWCEYVLSGLKEEIDKIDKLLDYRYLSNKILRPAILFSLDRQIITPVEARILIIAAVKVVFKAEDVRKVFSNKIPAEISRVLKGLRNKKMIVPEKENTRRYVLNFENNYMLRGIIEMLDRNGFLPLPLND